MTTKQYLLAKWRAINAKQDILDAFAAVPREHFIVDEEMKELAYHDQPLPTMRKQSLSQPSTVMIMLQALELAEGQQVFEVGAGVGYNAALMAHLVGSTGKITSTEVIPELVHLAKTHVEMLGMTNVDILEADGSAGYKGPYDRIIITAACPTIPQPLIDQLKLGGIVVAPVGDIEDQTMVKGIKREKGLDLIFLGPFKFVPLKGKYGFKEVEMYYE
jgi:protein-L-isoaspartate(D-aspartate) O-methyltransferase